MKIYKQGGRLLFTPEEETRQLVSRLLLDFERGGMDAIRKWITQRHGACPERFELTPQEIAQAADMVSQQTKEDIAYSQWNVRAFAKAGMAAFTPIEVEVRPGLTLGYRHDPVNCVGAYVPGGTYPLFGSAQMAIIPPKVAGVKTVVACTPPMRRDDSGLSYYPETAYAMQQAGADRIFLLGGIPAFAMMAFGMGVVPPADILCGAGNQYVEEAKRQLYGRCGIDLLAGPSEILVIADDSVSPAVTACDVLSQAEHDTDAGLCIICFSEDYSAACEQEIERQLQTLPTAAIASVSWKNNGRILIADDRQEAAALANDYAPEHLELLVRAEEQAYYLEHLTSYGELYIGADVTVAYGDKSSGTNHILPTGRCARFTGGVWVGTFLKTHTYQRVSRTLSPELGRIVERLCVTEQMPGHALAARLRVEGKV